MMKNIRIAIPEDLHKKIKMLAIELDKNQPDVIIGILQDYFDKKKGDGK